MSRWTDLDEWARLCRGEACPVCRDGGPLDVVAELESSWVTMGEDAPLPGYCCLVFRRHAVELHDLTPEEGAAFMRDLQRLSRPVQAASDAVKMNYEVHGNTLPHLHMHFFPRRPGDPFEGGHRPAGGGGSRLRARRARRDKATATRGPRRARRFAPPKAPRHRLKPLRLRLTGLPPLRSFRIGS